MKRAPCKLSYGPKKAASFVLEEFSAPIRISGKVSYLQVYKCSQDRFLMGNTKTTSVGARHYFGASVLCFEQ